MSDNFEKMGAEAAAFQKIWTETMSKMMQAAFTFTPNSPPPDVLRQIRNGIFQALAGSWEEFMRSPQFLEGMKQWMENAIVFRKMTNDFLARVRNDIQAPSRGDIDSIMLTVRHMEKRLLDRMDELSARINEPNPRAASRTKAQRTTPSAARRKSPRVAPQRSPGNGKAGAA